MRRAAPVWIAVAASPLVLVLIGGLEARGGGGIMLLAPLGLAGLGWALFRWSGRAVPELGWRVPVRLPPPDVTDAHPPPPALEPTARPPATRRQVASALARFESREWWSNPWFGVGVGFCALLTLLFGWLWAGGRDGFDGTWREWFVLMPIFAHPLVGMAVVAAHHAVTRARRDGVDELLEACPVDEGTRTSGHLLSAWVPAAVMVVFTVVVTVLLAVRVPVVYGPLEPRALADSLAGVTLVVAGTWLGVALARWAPWRLVPVVVVAALLFPIVGLGNIGDPHWSNARQLSSWPRFPDHDLLFTDPPVWWHLLWLAALAAVVAVIAVARGRRDRPVLLAGVVVAAAALVAGVAETRPLPDTAAGRLASLVAEPAEHQTCRSVDSVRLCAYEDYEDYLDLVVPGVRPVAAALPDQVGPVTLRQRFDGDLDKLGPEVGAALDRLGPAGSGGDLPLGFSTTTEAEWVVRLTIALHAVGLPVEPPAGLPQNVTGEARGVVALWLAARGLEPRAADDLLRPDLAPESPGGALERGMAWPDPCYGERPAPVAWSAQDLEAARALVTLPDGEVHELILSEWERFTAAETTTDDLLEAAGLEPVGPFDDVRPAPVECPY